MNIFTLVEDFAGCGPIHEFDVYNYRINSKAYDNMHSVDTPFGTIIYIINQDLCKITFKIPIQSWIIQDDDIHYYHISLYFGNVINTFYQKFTFKNEDHNHIYCNDLLIEILNKTFDYTCQFNNELYWGIWNGC